MYWNKTGGSMCSAKTKKLNPLLRECNRLANKFAKSQGYFYPYKHDFRYSKHPQESEWWRLAAIAYAHIAKAPVEMIICQEME
jgi:hypothetical protein